MPYYKTDGGTYIYSTYPISGGGAMGTADYHGGYAFEHRTEMRDTAEAVANEIFNKKIQEILPELQQAAYDAAYKRFMENLTFDVSTCVNVAVDNAGTIFSDSKTQKVIADNIMKEIERQFSGKYKVRF